MPDQQHLVGLQWPQATGLLASKTLLLQEVLKQEATSKERLKGIVTFSSILLHDEPTDTLRTIAAISDHPPSSKAVTLVKEQKGITRWVFEQRELARVDDVRNDPKWRKLYHAGDSRTLSEMDVPLRREGAVIGVINFESDQKAAFSEDDRPLLEGIAEQAVETLSKAEQQQQVQREELLQAIKQQIASTLDLQQILRTILKAAGEHLPSSFKSTIRLYDPETESLRVAAFHSNDPEYSEENPIALNQGKGITRWAFTKKSPALVDNVREDPRWRDLYLDPGFKSLSELDVPLLDGDQPIGVINFESREEAAFSPDDRAFLEALAEQTVVAINNAKAVGFREPAVSQVEPNEQLTARDNLAAQPSRATQPSEGEFTPVVTASPSPIPALRLKHLLVGLVPTLLLLGSVPLLAIVAPLAVFGVAALLLVMALGLGWLGKRQSQRLLVEIRLGVVPEEKAL